MISVLLTIILVGVILWAVNTFIPMDGNVKNILNVVAIVLLVIWLFSALFGVGPALPSVNLR